MTTSNKLSQPSRRSFLTLAGSGAATVLAGCTSQEPADDVSPVDDDDDTPTETEPDTGGDGEEENELVNLATQVIGTIDPAKHTDYTEVAAVLNYYDPLVYVDPETNKPSEFIATGWTVENNGRTWVFDLRDDVTFHDGGTLTADDVVYTINRNLAIGLGYSSLWAGIVEQGSAEARSDTTVAFDTTARYGPFLATLVQLFIVDSETVMANEQDGEFGERGDYGQAYLKENVAGSGPYTLGSWQSGSEMVYEAFDEYWQGWDENSFDTARMKVIEEESTIRTLMQQGDADMTSQFLSTESYEAMAGFDNVEVAEVSQLQLFHLPINVQKPPTDDINVRKAIVHAFDYETAVNDIIKGGDRAAGPVPRQMAGHNDAIEPYEQDFDAARAALEASDYTVDEINDIGIEQVFVANFPLERKVALLLTENLKELGITEVENNPQQWATITDRAGQADSTPHITHIFHTAKFPSPDGHTYLMYHPSSYGSYISMSWYSTDELQTLLQEARTTVNLDERLEKYKQAQELIVEGYPSVFVANPPYRIGLNKNLGGWQYRGVLSFDLRWSTMHRTGDGRAT